LQIIATSQSCGLATTPPPSPCSPITLSALASSARPASSLSIPAPSAQLPKSRCRSVKVRPDRQQSPRPTEQQPVQPSLLSAILHFLHFFAGILWRCVSTPSFLWRSLRFPPRSNAPTLSGGKCGRPNRGWAQSVYIFMPIAPGILSWDRPTTPACP
jgi:hypothetical protein